MSLPQSFPETPTTFLGAIKGFFGAILGLFRIIPSAIYLIFIKKEPVELSWWQRIKETKRSFSAAFSESFK